MVTLTHSRTVLALPEWCAWFKLHQNREQQAGWEGELLPWLGCQQITGVSLTPRGISDGNTSTVI